MKKPLLICISLFLLHFSLKSQVTTFQILESESSIDASLGKVDVKVNGKSENNFRTAEMGTYLFLNERKKVLRQEIKKAMDVIYDVNIPEEKRTEESKKIDEIEKELKNIKKTQKELYNAYVKDYLLYKKVNFLNFGYNRSIAFYDLVYNRVVALRESMT